MTENFSLPTLHLGTVFDEPIVPLEVPGVLSKGASSAMCILDGADRAPLRLVRLIRPVGLIGVKLNHPGGGVRVTVRLLADDLSTTIWDRHTLRQRGEPTPEDKEYIPSDVSSRHRLVEITAQGRSRALAVLALRKRDDGVVRQKVSFEVGAKEIGDSGLLMIGFERPRRPPEWASQRELDDSLVGLCIARMGVDAAESELDAQVSTGRPGAGASAIAATNPGFFVVNPRADGGAVELGLTLRGSGGERLSGRRAKAKHPLRAVLESVEDRRASVESAPARVEVVDLDGATVLDATVESQAGQHRLDLRPDIGPVFVRARKQVRGELRAVGWDVTVKPAP